MRRAESERTRERETDEWEKKASSPNAQEVDFRAMLCILLFTSLKNLTWIFFYLCAGLPFFFPKAQEEEEEEEEELVGALNKR